jgi:hypothetical protein
MQLGGPAEAREHADLVRPCRNGREVAAGRVLLDAEDVAEHGQDGGVEMNLGNGSDDFVACRIGREQ